jgi:two-component system, NarL family, sensor kinase
MPTGSESLYLSVTTQLLLTSCLVTLLWALYARLRRFEFFRWWAWAWTSFAIYLATATVSLRLGPAWTVRKATFVSQLIVSGYVQSMLLVFGGLSWRNPKRISPGFLWRGLVIAFAAAAISFALSFSLHGFPAASFAIRNVPRTLALACALQFCGAVFWREFRRSRSYAAATTGFFCLVYSINQLVYCLSFSEMLLAHWNWQFPAVLQRVANTKYVGGSALLFLDLLYTCGICLGMILLLVERYQHTASELEVSERRRLGLAMDNASLQSEIENRRRIEEELRQSECRYRDLVEHSEDLLGTHRLDGQIVSINEAPCRHLGYTVEEVLQMKIQDLLSPQNRVFYPQFVQRVLETGQAAGLMTVATRDGEERIWEYRSTLRTDDVAVPLIRGMAHDVTERFRAQQELKDHITYMQALLANIPLAIVIKDENQLVRFCNPAFERMFQFTPAEIQGKNLDDLIAPHDRREAAQLSHAVQTGGVVHATARRRRKDGTFLDVELHGIRVFSGNSFVGAFAIYQDISDRKRSEEKLISLRNRLSRAQEEERARIARDLHDDAGQRLALLSIDLEQLKQASMRIKSSLTEQLETLVRAASEITSDVHNVSRRLHPSQVELLGLAAALCNFCKDFGTHNEMDIAFVDGGLNDKPPQDAALCLFRVAQEAIRNVQKHSGARRAVVQLDEITGSIRLRVSDEGEGFDPDSADFTQGLGLLSMQERLHSLGGELFIHSRLGGGTCVEACIPLKLSVAR